MHHNKPPAKYSKEEHCIKKIDPYLHHYNIPLKQELSTYNKKTALHKNGFLIPIYF